MAFATAVHIYKKKIEAIRINGKNFIGFVVGFMLLTPVDDVIIGRVLFPDVGIVKIIGAVLMVFFGYKLVKHYRG